MNHVMNQDRTCVIGSRPKRFRLQSASYSRPCSQPHAQECPQPRRRAFISTVFQEVPRRAVYGTSTGGRVYSGTAVPTGRGPLDQPIPPAASSYYSRQLGRAATPTNPSPYPFGTQ